MTEIISTPTPIFELACVGRAAVDLYGEQVGARLEDVATFAKYLGGSPANTAVGASRLGLSAAMITRVGDEQNGRFVRETFEREGVDVSQVGTDPNRLTALVFLAIRGPDDFPHTFYRERCADMALAAQHIDSTFVASCGALLISGTHLSQEEPRRACEKAIAAARAAGRRVILDIDYRPVLWGLARHGEGAARYVESDAVSRVLAPMLRDFDLIVGTEEEIRIAGGLSDTLAALDIIRSRSRALIVLKRGSAGCIAFEGAIPQSVEQGLVVAGSPVEVFNALGAGDAFMAGFLRGWLRAEPLERCCQFANACGALVVSRHGCSPAMPTWTELERFLATGPSTPRVREDRELEHLHRVTTRRAIPQRLCVLAFDHRSQLEVIARQHGAPVERIPHFKALVATAFETVAQRHAGTGVLLDERYGAEPLARLTGRGVWIARPVEVPGSVPVAFEAGPELGLALRQWPTEHVAKCLVYYQPEDAASLKAIQIDRLAQLAHACAATGREWLLEVIPPPQAARNPLTVARAVDEIYAAGIRPDWWKLPPVAHESAWQAIEKSIDARDPACRGVLVLGMEAGTEALRESFEAAARSRRVKGFAVGRTIFADAAQAWFAGTATDGQVIASVVQRYEEVIALWDAAARGASGTKVEQLEKT